MTFTSQTENAATPADMAADIVAVLAAQPPARTALIVVDAQNDFSDDFAGAALAVTGAGVAVQVVNNLLSTGRNLFEYQIFTRDFHIDPGTHFAAIPDFVDTWPAHCVAGTAGADFHPGLFPDGVSAAVEVRKGMHAAAYSAFDTGAATFVDGVDSNTNLGDWLTANSIERVVVVGVATDFCVAQTVIDAARFGFEVLVPLAATAAVSEPTCKTALAAMAAAGNVSLFGAPQ